MLALLALEVDVTAGRHEPRGRMIELVLVYCLATDEASCIEKRDPFQHWDNPLTCMMQAQTLARGYVREHPNWRLSKWRCEIDVPRQEKA